MKSFIPVILLALLPSCYSPGKEPGIAGKAGGNAYARGFRIENLGDFKLLEVRDPWQGSTGIRFRYLLASGPAEIPDSLSLLPRIRIPVSRVVCLSTTHVAMIHALGQTSSIVGISGPEYISNPELRRGIREGKVLDIGSNESLNYERIISLDPDLVFTYGITSEVSGMISRLGELDIPVILNGDYLENEPLGKTEWIRFMAAFYGLDGMADSIFASIRMAYEEYRKLAENATHGPRVMTGLPWKDSWYIPGGESFAAAFIRDAGGKYVWSDIDSHEAAPVDLESVYARCAEADIWINCGSARSLEDIRQTDARLVLFKPFREGAVYNNTARLNPSGGNDFWETGVMEPHLILADLIGILHPGLLSGHESRYYEQLR